VAGGPADGGGGLGGCEAFGSATELLADETQERDEPMSSFAPTTTPSPGHSTRTAMPLGLGGRWQGGVVGDAGGEVVDELRRAGVGRGDMVALTVAPGLGMAMASSTPEVSLARAVEDPSAVVALVEEALRPRWVLWSSDTATTLLRAGVRVATCWDIAAVHRLIFGGWRADPPWVWARLHNLATDTIPNTSAPPNLFDDGGPGGDPDDPVGPDGHLRPEWTGGAWCATVGRLGQWADLASTVAAAQQALLDGLANRPPVSVTARYESAAELLCAEMSLEGLPMDRGVAETIVAEFIGVRPASENDAADGRARRDAEVLCHAPAGIHVDLRSPAQVKTLLNSVGINLPDTRAGRLRAVADTHPIIEAILRWRKTERIATTYGWAWLDQHLGADGRLRGTWTASDGAAGRMTASGGLHNMPAEMRAAVVAERGYFFGRADLGQIEPRVLAAVSGDEKLARASLEPDMYAPMASQLGVDRATAKVAMLGAMYGQTTGHGGQALRRLQDTYPVAMAYLDDAARSAQSGRDLRTHGGRRIVMAAADITELSAPGARAARGRYGRNAVVQGAAAELFKLWAVTVRARSAPLGAPIVLCLHDELLVHVPVGHGDTIVALLEECLQEAVRRWAPDNSVRFIADITVIQRWSDAKTT
jgi:DNA polymerase-1